MSVTIINTKTSVELEDVLVILGDHHYTIIHMQKLHAPEVFRMYLWVGSKTYLSILIACRGVTISTCHSATPYR